MIAGPPAEPVAATKCPWIGRERSSATSPNAAVCARHGIGRRRPSRSNGRETEVGELVVQEEAVDHAARAEDALDGRGHRHHIARLIDDHECGRAAGFDRVVRAGRTAPGGRPAAGLRRVVVADQRRAVPEVAGVEQAGDRHGEESRDPRR